MSKSGRKVEVYHVFPVNDVARHTESVSCPCNPQKITEHGASQLIIHNAFDGREIEEAKIQESRAVR